MITAVVAFALFALTAFAQPGAQPRDTKWGREQIETVIIGKFAEELNLTPEQAERFFPRFRQFQNETDELMRSQMSDRDELYGLSADPNANPQRVDELLQVQREREKRMADLKQQFLQDISGVLTPQQVSRCSILMEELPRRVHQFIQENRRDYPPSGESHKKSRNRPHRRGY